TTFPGKRHPLDSQIGASLPSFALSFALASLVGLVTRRGVVAAAGGGEWRAVLAAGGNLSIDRVGGGPPRIGGGPYYAARALRLLAARGEVVARCGDADRRFLG